MSRWRGVGSGSGRVASTVRLAVVRDQLARRLDAAFEVSVERSSSGRVVAFRSAHSEGGGARRIDGCLVDGEVAVVKSCSERESGMTIAAASDRRLEVDEPLLVW